MVCEKEPYLKLASNLSMKLSSALSRLLLEKFQNGRRKKLLLKEFKILKLFTVALAGR
jgi:hypothetical protein